MHYYIQASNLLTAKINQNKIPVNFKGLFKPFFFYYRHSINVSTQKTISDSTYTYILKYIESNPEHIKHL